MTSSTPEWVEQIKQGRKARIAEIGNARPGARYTR